MLQIGSLVDGKYKILNKVGQGGMSVVYLAMNEKANKQWAVKEVRKDGVLDFEAVKQGLVAETDILKKLNHPNLPSIIDVIDTDDSFIIIMDYIEGNSLNKALKEHGALPQESVIEWAKQLCDVLGYLHTRNPAIIYRDMKPSNVMLKPDGNVTLIDFGTAREFKSKNTADTTCLGTVGYAAPEQFGGMGQTDGRTDIYCLGATLYHLVTGMNPCEPPYEIRPIRQINPALSGGLEKIIQKCTQRDPNDRYQSCAELMYALEHYDEIDDAYRKKQKTKLGLFVGSCALSLAFAATSVFGYVQAQNEKSANYDYILANADDAKDYYEAMTTDPTRTDAYLGTEDFDGLIEFLIKDSELDGDDNSILVKLRGGIDQKDSRNFSKTIYVLDELERADEEGYREVCNEIGKAYLFYYTVGVEKDKYAAAATWFQHSDDPMAEVYCDIAECLTNISKYSKAEQYSSLYTEYQSLWDTLVKLKDDSESDDYNDDNKTKIWNEIVNMINNNAKEFTGVLSQEEVLDMLNDIALMAEDVESVFAGDSMERLLANIETTRTKVESIKLDAVQQ